MKKWFLTLAIVSILAMSLLTASVGATPRAEGLGVEPLYDSGWVLTTYPALQSFEHDLGKWPTLWTVLVADTVSGSYSTASPTRDKHSTSSFGHLVVDLSTTDIEIGWQPTGIGYTADGAKWLQAGTDYGRVIIFAADIIELRP